MSLSQALNQFAQNLGRYPHVFGLSQAGLMEADVTVETLGVGVESGDPQGEPIVADGALARLNQSTANTMTMARFQHI